MGDRRPRQDPGQHVCRRRLEPGRRDQHSRRTGEHGLDDEVRRQQRALPQVARLRLREEIGGVDRGQQRSGQS